MLCPRLAPLAGLFLGLFPPAAADEATLARLSLWVPPCALAEFEETYEKEIAPLLEGRGLTASSEVGRTPADSVFSAEPQMAGLFQVETPAQVGRRRRGPLRRPAFYYLHHRRRVGGCHRPAVPWVSRLFATTVVSLSSVRR